MSRTSRPDSCQKKVYDLSKKENAAEGMTRIAESIVLSMGSAIKEQVILLISPIPGPPNTRMSSLDEPPLSLIGIILILNQSLFSYIMPRGFVLLAQGAFLFLCNLAEYINQAICSAATGKDYNSVWIHTNLRLAICC